MTRKTSKDLDIRYFNFCASRYICNNKQFFLNFWLKSYKFEIVGGEITRSKEVGSIYLPIYSRVIITLNNIIYALRCHFNLI